MIMFGSAVTDFAVYERCAVPGLDRVKESDSVVLAHRSIGSVFRNYNFILGEARKRDDLEALVLIHQDAELVDPDFCEIIRTELRDPDVALIGCAGAVGVRSIAWWEGGVTWAGFNHRYEELGGGDLPAMTWDREQIPPYVATGEVDSIDGFVIVLSPWAVNEVEFDETMGDLHGYDFDLCCQVRMAGKKVVTADFRAIHHHSLDVINDPGGWKDSYVRVIEKWEGKLPNVREPENLKMYSLRSEAEAAFYRARLNSYHHKLEALDDLVREMQTSNSWRLTRPLRAIGRLLRRPRRRRERPI
jgi:Glycosyltransferase like family